MKSNFKLLAIVLSLGLFLQSCDTDDEPTPLNAPVISSFEYGEGHHDEDEDEDHDHEEGEAYAFRGSDLHLEAEITAEAIVQSITISIHSHDLVPGEDEVEWDYEKVYTDAQYLALNPSFHEHIDIPANIPTGEYHIELVVTDQQGNVTEMEGHIDIIDIITLGDISIDSSVARGEDFHVEFMIDAVHGIHSISVDAHGHDIPVGDGEVEWDFEEEYLGDYHEQTSVEFHEHIDVPATAPAGEYHITFTVEDEDGNTKEIETHIDVTE